MCACRNRARIALGRVQSGMRKGARRVVVSLLLGLGIAGLHPPDAAASGINNCDFKTMGKPPCDCPPCASCGDPVDTRTGNLFEQVTDYETTGPNKLSFIRYYNAYLREINGLGENWRSNFDRSLSIFGTTASVDRPDGQNLTFTQSGSAWVGDSDIDVQLSQSGSTWTVTDKDDTVETYTAISASKTLLNSIRMRNGYTQMLQYNSSNLLVLVTDSYGRSLHLTYQGGFLSTVATPDGLAISYSYIPIFGGFTQLLAQVTYSTNPATSLTYLYENTQDPFLLTGIIDENGNRFATWTYDDKARAISSQHAGGADLTTMSYTDDDTATTATNALGQTTINHFVTLQGIPKITQIARVGTASQFFTYDANGYKASETDWNGNLTSYVNDAHGQPTTITEAAGTPQQRITTITYHQAFHLPLEIVAPGLTTDFTYDANGNLLSRTETDTTTNTVPYATNGQIRKWTYTWSDTGLPLSMIDSRGGTTRFGYDNSGALTSITTALVQVTQITQHTGGGLPQTIVDPNGVVSNLAYDARQRLVSRTVNTAAGPMTTTDSYDAAGNLIQVTQPDGSALANTYDAAHRLVATADLFSQQIQYTLDALGDRTQTNVLNSTSAVIRQHSANFDALGRTLQDIGGVGQTTTYVYDSNGNRSQITDPLGRVTHQVFDALNRRTQITDPAIGVATTAYDAQDHPVVITDPNGNSTSYVYDGFGDLIGQTSPDSGATVSYYDAAGNLLQHVDARDAVTNFAYDALNRLVSKTFPANPSENVTFTYDEPAAALGIGRLTTVIDNGGMTGALKLNYDERGNVVSAVRRAGTVTLATAYAYDAASRFAAITYPSGWTAAYTRDQMGRVTAIGAQPPSPVPPRGGRLASFGKSMPALGLPAASSPVANAISYLPFGPVSGLSYGNGIVETRAFDLDYRATGIADTGAATMQSLSYSYDAANNVTATADGVTPGNSQSFGYDALDRLVTAAGGYGSLTYAYDPVGNRLTSTANDGYQSATVNFSYAAGNNRLTALMQGGTATRQFSYTASGNAASDLKLQAGAWVGNDLHYNQGGRLATVVTGPASGKASQSTSYAYDAFGQRLLKQAPQGLRFYQYDQAGHLLEEGSLSNGSAAPERDYIYLGDRPVAVLLPSTGALFFLHGDRLDTPQFATDTAQRAEWKAAYQPFGTIRPVILNLAQNLRLPGQYADQETGYYHNGFRTYAADLGRYLESDPIGLGGGLNTYAYARNNPIARSDPLGLKDYGGDWTTAILDQAYQSATSDPTLSLYNIAGNSKGNGPYDFSWNEHQHDRFCVNGKWMSPGEFGNYLAGYQAGAYAATYPTSPVPALGVVRGAGIAYHVIPGQSKAPFYDPLDTTGMPFINSGIDAGYARGWSNAVGWGDIKESKCPCK
jgi:RHS repeat-associated protein